jgi:hypothetical protein
MSSVSNGISSGSIQIDDPNDMFMSVWVGPRIVWGWLFILVG